MMTPPILKTSNLILRPLTLEDAKELARLANDIDVHINTTDIPYPCTAKWMKNWLRPLIGSPCPVYAIEIRQEDIPLSSSIPGTLIGMTGLIIDSPNNKAEIGYWSGREYWGKGYSTEAHARLLKYGFKVLKLHRIYGKCLVTNKAIENICVKKLGMTEEGVLRDEVMSTVIRGLYNDVKVFGILRAEYLWEQQDND